jgi:hypothetical protein
MVTLATVEQQLKTVGCNFRFWGRAELRELCEILLPGETIAQAVNGQYEAGFAMLVATDFRVLLIDKKPKYLTLKDIRFDMITELDFSARMMNSTVRIYTPNKELRFTTPSPKRLRKLFTYTQHKVMEIRHHFMMQQFQQQHEIRNTPPGVAMMQQQYQNQPLPEGQYQQALPAQQAGFYNPTPIEPSDEQRRLAAAMGNAGLRSIVHNGQVIKEYMTVPFAQRWRKRPYGYSRDSMGRQTVG